VPFCEGAAGAAFEISLKSFGEDSFGQGNVCGQQPRLEFVRVDRFAGVVFRTTFPQVSSCTNVAMVGMIDAVKNINVIPGGPPSLVTREFGNPTIAEVVVALGVDLRRASTFAQ
jgi:hypothetical protein